MSNVDPRGKFVWHELLTTDAAAATAFYTKVVPWKTQAWEADSSYSMWVAKNGPVGGIAALGDSGAPHWLPYIGVADVAATVESAKELGARVLTEPSEIPNGGRYAVLADPQGAEFAIYASETHSDGSPPPGAGDFTWHELATSDAKAAMDFYTKLFGWEAGPVHDMGPSGLYHLFLYQGNQYGGIYVADNGSGPSWLCYIGVEDAGKAVAAAKAAGGRVLNGPMEVPGGSWVAQVLDKEGAPFAIHEPSAAPAAQTASESTKPAKKPKAPKSAKPAAASAETPAPETAEAAASADEAPAAKPASKAAKKAGTAAKPVAAESAAAKPATKAAAAKGKKAAAKKSAAKKAAPKSAKKSARKATGKAAPAKGKAKKTAAKGKGRAKKSAGANKSAKSAPARKKARAKAKKHR